VQRQRPTDQTLEYRNRSVGVCFRAEERRARFHVEKGAIGDAFLDCLERSRIPVRLAKLSGPKSYVVEGELARSVAGRSVAWERPSGPVYIAGAGGRILEVNGRAVTT
jgi:hypothetical protein